MIEINGLIYAEPNGIYVDLIRDGKVLDEAGPFDDVAEALDVARRWVTGTIDFAVGR